MAARQEPAAGQETGPAGRREPGFRQPVRQRVVSVLLHARVAVLRVLARRRALFALVHRHLDYLRQVQRVAVGVLGDLLPAGEAVGDEQRLQVGLPDGGQQHALSGFDRDVVVLPGFVAERPGQPATTGIEHLVIQAEPVEQRGVVL